MVSVAGSRVVITGGQRGLGKALTAEFLRRGAAKIYATARDPNPSENPRVASVVLDVTDDESIVKLAETATDANIVINNAGIINREPLLSSDITHIRDLFETNVFGALRVAQLFAPILARNGGGVLVDIHSVLSWLGGFGAYGASKAALWSATNSLRVELYDQKTLVVGVHLGYADTEMNNGLDVPKLDPSQVAGQIADAIETGVVEVLADDVTRMAKNALSGPVVALEGTWAI